MAAVSTYFPVSNRISTRDDGKMKELVYVYKSELLYNSVK